MNLQSKEYSIESSFKLKALHWAASFEQFSFLNYSSNSISYCQYPTFSCILAVGAKHIVQPTIGKVLQELDTLIKSNKHTYYGYIGYDVKNEIEKLSSQNTTNIQFPEAFFFSPIHTIEFINDKVIIQSEEPDSIFHTISTYDIPTVINENSVQIKQRISREEYISNVNKIKNHIVEGDIYELNYCIDFYAEDVSLSPIASFLKLIEVSPMPFSVLFKNNGQYILSASPERFLKKEGSKLIAQPMKGTARRSENLELDKQLKDNLKSSEKEQAENIMIVDLMRNDLARSSQYGSVKVEELFGVYSLSTVHQMVSTITSEKKEGISTIEIIKNAFPMGSMTGAPKIRAMELIDNYEKSKRGLFSGAFGYFSPNGDFDFNVIIRSLFYDSENKSLNFWAGSAITYDSIPEKEYEECLLKASAIMKVLE